MNRKKVFCLALLSATLIFGATFPYLRRAGDYFANWPKGASPRKSAKKSPNHFVASQHQYTFSIHYAEIATWYGALNFAN